ncbi:MAG: ribosome biogenesis GTPase Der [Cytophagales bacterium]|nr:MAG: ribosome biogenesis GTPase Der [Cytophagales bacterium]
MTNIIAIVGRPNVGKSTLFNRLIEERKAIMDNQSGVTRDRIYGKAQWGEHFFTVIDTGGYVEGSEDTYENAIRNQVIIAVEEAQVILFVVDLQTGITDLDKEFANIIRPYNKPTLIVVNKTDQPIQSHLAGEFYALGIGEIFPISAQNGSGTGDLLDEVVRKLPQKGDEKDPYEHLPKIAIVGRPNAGKSSFINVLLGEERSIVTDLAGTTRDAIHSHYKAFGKEFLLIDTAGLRRKTKVKEDIEFYSVMRTVRAIEETDVCIVMIDATRGFESQDMNIISLAERNHKGIIIMINKWDMIEKDHKTAQAFQLHIKKKLGEMAYIPVIFTSVIEKQRIFQTINKAIDIYQARAQKLSTSALNKAILPEIENYPPPAYKGKYVQIKYITQLPPKNPTFAFFCNLPQYIKDPYKRFLENQIRKHFDFDGVPIQIFFRKK